LQAWWPRAALLWNTPAWSLSVEALFYALFPLILRTIEPMATIRQKRALILLCATWVALGAVGQLSSADDPGTTLFWLINAAPPIRLIEFVIGMLTCRLYLQGDIPQIPLGPAAIAVGAFFFGASRLHDISGHLMVPAIALLLVAAAQRDARGERSWFGSPLAVLLGVWSYAFYLVHSATLGRLEAALGPPSGLLSGLAYSALGLGLGILIAGVLHVAVERPAERRLRGAPPPERGQAVSEMSA
jgi:peptidoglycan/LPS O-acetylase OafA/YrhL